MQWSDITDSLLAIKRLVVGAVAGVLTLQEHVDLTECRSQRPLGPPTLEHQVVDLSRTFIRLV